MKGKFAAAMVLGLAVFGASYSPLFAQAKKSVWDGIYTDAQATKGQALYAQYCSSCHGDTLAGGEEAPPLAGGDFQSNWNGETVGALFDRIRTTMPLSKPQSLNVDTNSQILAYMLSVNKFPAGKSDLDARGDVLKQIAFQSSKPEGK